MTDKPPMSKEVRALLALGTLCDRLQTDLLELPGVAERWQVKVESTMNLVPGCVVAWNTLFSVFRSAADGGSIPPLIDSKGNDLKAAISLDGDGAALVAFGQHRLRFAHVIFAASDAARRTAALGEIIARISLSQESRQKLTHLVGDPNYSVDHFLAVSEILASSPDEFAARLSEKTAATSLTLSDMLPRERSYWESLTAPRTTSTEQSRFIADELMAERQAKLALDPSAAFRSIALAFSAPSLVPYELMAPLAVESKIDILQAAVCAPDHFTLIGAFELCAAWLDEDPRFVGLGDLLLEAMFGNMTRLEVSCGMFAAAFVLAAAKLGEDEGMKTEPAFWRRLASASHAQLVVRACGVTEIDHGELLQRAINQSGEIYFASMFSDFATDPRWRPEWIENRFLIADTCGRALGAFARIPEERKPQSWHARINVVEAWIDEKNLSLLMLFPAVTEGERRGTDPVLLEHPELAEAFQQFLTDPTVEKLLLLTPWISAFGFPREALGALAKVTDAIRSLPLQDDEPEQTLLNTLRLLAHISAMLQDANLAGAIAGICIERLAVTTKRQHALELMHRVIECAAADSNHENATTSLVQDLEQISRILPHANLLAEFGALLKTLKRINPAFKTRFGRAIAWAKLGSSSLAGYEV